MIDMCRQKDAAAAPIGSSQSSLCTLVRHRMALFTQRWTSHTSGEKVKKPARDLQLADYLPLLILAPEFPKPFPKQARVETQNYSLYMS